MQYDVPVQGVTYRDYEGVAYISKFPIENGSTPPLSHSPVDQDRKPSLTWDHAPVVEDHVTKCLSLCVRPQVRLKPKTVQLVNYCIPSINNKTSRLCPTPGLSRHWHISRWHNIHFIALYPLLSLTCP